MSLDSDITSWHSRVGCQASKQPKLQNFSAYLSMRYYIIDMNSLRENPNLASKILRINKNEENVDKREQ